MASGSCGSATATARRSRSARDRSRWATAPARWWGRRWVRAGSGTAVGSSEGDGDDAASTITVLGNCAMPSARSTYSNRPTSSNSTMRSSPSQPTSRCTQPVVLLGSSSKEMVRLSSTTHVQRTVSPASTVMVRGENPPSSSATTLTVWVVAASAGLAAVHQAPTASSTRHAAASSRDRTTGRWAGRVGATMAGNGTPTPRTARPTGRGEWTARAVASGRSGLYCGGLTGERGPGQTRGQGANRAEHDHSVIHPRADAAGAPRPALGPLRTRAAGDDLRRRGATGPARLTPGGPPAGPARRPTAGSARHGRAPRATRRRRSWPRG